MVMTSEPPKAAKPSMHPPAPAKFQSLHNFPMPFLKWGTQKHLRCMKPNRNNEIIRSSHSKTDSLSASPASNNLPPFTASCIPAATADEDSDLGIEEIREKLLVHLRTAAKKMKLRVPEKAEEEPPARPWNLRTRRAACTAPSGDAGESRRDIQASATENQMKSSRLRSFAEEKNGEKKERRRKFSVVLSKEEIEEDFFVITGSKPARRPKKRARNIQKQLDISFPGLWLSEITLDTYKVPESHHYAKG